MTVIRRCQVNLPTASRFRQRGGDGATRPVALPARHHEHVRPTWPRWARARAVCPVLPGLGYVLFVPWPVVGNAEFMAPGTGIPLAVFPVALKFPATARNSQPLLSWPPGYAPEPPLALLPSW